MKKIFVLAILIALIGVSGCSFFMKEYDDRNERALAALTQENKDLTVKVKNLERKVPEMSRQLDDLDTENRKLKDDLVALDRKIVLSDTASIDNNISTAQGSPSLETAPAPAPAPEEQPFSITSTKETTPSKPETQASSKLTAAGAKLLEMAKMQEGSGDEPKLSDFAAKPAEEVAAEPAEEPKAEPEINAETAPTAQPAIAEPSEKPEPQPEKTASKSVLTSEGARLLALAKGEPVPASPSKEASPAPQEQKEAKIKQLAKAKTQPASSPQSKAANQSFKLKVLSGTGNITSAHAMAKKLKGMGFEAEKKALAPRADFKENVVYYSKGYEQAADDLKSKIGGNTTVKPLSWNSEFDIIVVSVE